MSTVAEADVAMTRTIAAAASSRMPFEKVSRSPFVASCRGRNSSRARREASPGKPSTAVFAAARRTRAVMRTTMKNITGALSKIA